jgi:hypothetical protein
LKTNPHFSSTWTSRVRGGKSDEFVVEFLGVGAGFGQVARHGVLIDLDQATGGPRPAAFLDVLQDGEGLSSGRRACSRTVPLRSEKQRLQVRQ